MTALVLLQRTVTPSTHIAPPQLQLHILLILIPGDAEVEMPKDPDEDENKKPGDKNRLFACCRIAISLQQNTNLTCMLVANTLLKPVIRLISFLPSIPHVLSF